MIGSQTAWRLLTIALALVLSACGAGAASEATWAGATSAPQPAPSVTPLTALAALAGRVSPCDTPAEEASGAPAPGGEGSAGVPEVSYDGDSRTIVMRQGAPTTLAVVARALGRPDLLQEIAPGEWLLSANLEVRNDAALRIAGPEVRWLKLRSDDEGFVAVKAVGGRLELADTCISSWDQRRERYDQDLADGRSFVLAREGARMDIHRSELRYLGYDAHESFGVAWRMSGTRGEIVDSTLAYNYFGMYSYEASDLVMRGNEVHHNVLYGLDPHTRSKRLVIEGNVVHHNGKHGIILADECSDSVVRGNVVYNNLHHGIVLYRHSDANLVEDNTLYGNAAHGININESSTNVVRNNVVYENLEAGIGIGQQARGNQVVGNLVHANRKDGVVLYSAAADTELQGNIVSDNQRYGIYLKSAGGERIAGNQVSGNQVGVFLNVEPAPDISRRTNRIAGNREADVRSAVVAGRG
jgi:parallel beta-helix repeat protein